MRIGFRAFFVISLVLASGSGGIANTCPLGTSIVTGPNNCCATSVSVTLQEYSEPNCGGCGGNYRVVIDAPTTCQFTVSTDPSTVIKGDYVENLELRAECSDGDSFTIETANNSCQLYDHTFVCDPCS